MTEPMYVGYYKIIWSQKRQKFVVKSVNGTNVLYESACGKDCNDWCIVQNREVKDEEGEEE